MGTDKLTKFTKRQRPLFLHVAENAGNNGTTVHGNLTGLGNDDHTQYYNAARHTLAVHTSLGLVANTRQIINGTGISGGGDFSADRTLSINQAFSPSWTGSHSFSLNAAFNGGATIAGGQNLTFGADVNLTRKAADTLQLAAGDALQSATYASGISGWNISADGSAEFSNARIRGELVSTVFKYNEIQATAGTFGVFKSASTLYSDCTTPASTGTSFTLSAKNADGGGALFQVNDVLRVKDWDGTNVRDIWGTVTVASNQGSYTNYTVTLNYGSTSATVKAGGAVVDYGPSGSGFVTLSSDGAIGSSANITIADHAGSPWTTITLRTRLGNLNGTYDIGAVNDYGIGIGNYSTGNYLRYSAAKGFALKGGSGGVTIDENGITIVDNIGAFGVPAINKALQFGNSATPSSSISSFSSSTWPTNIFIETNKTYSDLGGYAVMLAYAGMGSTSKSQTSILAGDAGGFLTTGMGVFYDKSITPTAKYAVFSDSLLVGGQTIPQYTLDVVGTGRFRAGLMVGSPSVAASGEIRTSGNVSVGSTLYVGPGTSNGDAWLVANPNSLASILYVGNGSKFSWNDTSGTTGGAMISFWSNGSFGAGRLMLFGGGSTGYISFVTNNAEALNISTAQIVKANSTLCVGGDGGGVASTVGLTNVTSAAGGTNRLVKGGDANGNNGWIKVYIGTVACYIPYWATT